MQSQNIALSIPGLIWVHQTAPSFRSSDVWNDTGHQLPQLIHIILIVEGQWFEFPHTIMDCDHKAPWLDQIMQIKRERTYQQSGFRLGENVAQVAKITILGGKNEGVALSARNRKICRKARFWPKFATSRRIREITFCRRRWILNLIPASNGRWYLQSWCNHHKTFMQVIEWSIKLPQVASLAAANMSWQKLATLPNRGIPDVCNYTWSRCLKGEVQFSSIVIWLLDVSYSWNAVNAGAFR